MSATPRVFALIPAAGKSIRMGRPKLALSLGDRTVLECVIATLHSAGIGDILVVLGPHVAALTEKARAAGAEALVLAHETPDMRATVEQGLTWLESNRKPRPPDFFLLLPADHPTLDVDVIRSLLQAQAHHPDATLLVPTFAGQRGHPTLIGWSHVGGIRQLPPDQGLNAYLRSKPVREVSVHNAEVLHDLDTPEDYERLQRLP
jgi:molybdenum cofactor cytidylyltransferase